MTITKIGLWLVGPYCIAVQSTRYVYSLVVAAKIKYSSIDGAANKIGTPFELPEAPTSAVALSGVPPTHAI